MFLKKDNRGRTLQRGEGQNSDGRYIFTYRNKDKKQKKVYSWRLLPSDRTPRGKRQELSLREKEEAVRKALSEAEVISVSDLTVYELCDRYLKIRAPLMRHNTVVNYISTMKIIRSNPFGQLIVSEVTKTKAKIFLSALQNDEGRSYSALQNIRGILRPAFEQAVDDEMIRYNPFDFELKSVAKNDMVRREALTAEEENKFLSYVKQHRLYSKHYDIFFLQFHTGLRVSELCGITVSDINFEEHYVSVKRQLQRKGTMELYLTPPKTSAGVRKIPITESVERCLRNILKERPEQSKEQVVKSDDGTMGASGFLFFDKNRNPIVAQTVENYYRAAYKAYVRDCGEEMKKVISSHVARHTFCSLCVKEGMHPVTLQRIMGHSSIRTTLGWYAHLDDRDVIEEALKLRSGDKSLDGYLE